MYDLKKYAILAIDDEYRALNSFKFSFQNDFRILTAKNSAEAEEVLREKYSEIGIIISDHKMPGGSSGLDFLTECADKYPSIIRILITAYSNHELAIKALNTGVLYKYIIKPWEEETLFQTLLRAAEFFILQKEKNFLARERVTMMDQLVFTDRLRNLATLAEGLPLENTNMALKKFITFAPEDIFSEKQNSQDSMKNLMGIANQKNRAFMELIKEINETIDEKKYNFETYSLNSLIKEKETTAIVKINPYLPELKGNRHMMESLLKILSKYLDEITAEKIYISVETLLIDGTDGIKISIPMDTNPKKAEKNIWDLLPAFFVVYHHNGEINIGDTKIEITLPFDPDKVKKVYKQENEPLDDFFERFEAIKHYEAWLSIM